MKPTEKTELLVTEDGEDTSFCGRRYVYLTFLSPAFAGFLYGYSIGAASGSITSLQGLLDDPMSSIMKSALTSAEVLGALVASAIAFYIGDIIGRRKEILLGAFFYFVGTVFTQIAGEGYAYPVAFVGRMIYGVGIGFAMHAAPVYIAEFAPPDIRGLLIALKEAFIVGGMLVGYGLVAAVGGMDQEYQWRISWGFPGIIALIIAFLMWIGPESPRWLVMRGRSLDAVTALRYLRPSAPETALSRDVAEMESALGNVSSDTSEGGLWRQLCGAKRALLAGLGLVAFQQITGQPTVLYVAQTIFESAGFSEADAKYADVIVGGAKLLATLVSVQLVDKAGRRPLLFVGVAVMLVALLILSIGFGAGYELEAVDGSEEGEYVLVGAWPPVVVVALVLYVSGYQVGFGPITWVIIGECFPLHSRTRALGVAAISNFGINLLVTLTNGPLTDAVGASAVFGFYAAMCVASLVFIYYFVPETKGKTLEEIETMLKG